MPWGKPDIFVAEPLQTGWGSYVAPVPVEPTWHDDENKKKQFGIELAKDHASPFIAACEVFTEDTREALWASINWLTDPIVCAARDLYLKTIALDTTLLDKDQLSARLLQFADEKTPDGTRYRYDGKDRLGAYQLYSKIRGYTDSDDSARKANLFINSLTIKVVKAEPEAPKLIIDNKPKEFIDNDETAIVPLSVKLKAV